MLHKEELCFTLASPLTPILHKIIYKKEASSGQMQFEGRLCLTNQNSDGRLKVGHSH